MHENLEQPASFVLWRAIRCEGRPWCRNIWVRLGALRELPLSQPVGSIKDVVGTIRESSLCEPRYAQVWRGLGGRTTSAFCTPGPNSCPRALSKVNKLWEQSTFRARANSCQKTSQKKSVSFPNCLIIMDNSRTGDAFRTDCWYAGSRSAVLG